MIKDYRFKDIEAYLKKDAEAGENILEAFNKLADAAIIFTPVIFGPQFLPLLGLLDVKDRLVGLGKTVVSFIASKIEPNYIERAEQIRAAYALICYTAYFDVLQNELPENVRNKLKLKFQKKQELIAESKECSEDLQVLHPSPDIHSYVYYTDHATSITDIQKHLTTNYERITQGLIKLIAESSIFDIEKPKEKKQFEELQISLLSLPKKAIIVYEAQYLELAIQFEDFAYFAQLQNFKGIHRAINQNATALQKLSDTAKKIDVGLSNLNSLVNSIAINYSEIQSQDIVDELKMKYHALIEEPVIDDKEIKPDAEEFVLRFPRIVDAFIPQSYKCLLYQSKDTRLEDESIWNKLPIQHDLDRFFVMYLYSPDSIDYPLVILGHPGSGKSLLTKVLSAQLMSNSYTVIRIPLREVDADAGIDVLVEDKIKDLTSRPLSAQGYGGFAAQFKEKPILIILDGYDELLQAKGDVFTGYLEKARTFQQDQKTLKRPVRVIITSRITLIDKARVPENSTILRLMEFNTQQQQTWIDIWNSTNSKYFADSKIIPFKLPQIEKGEKSSLLELAEQPLLLLMLAIYDSERNELASTSNIKRTELYDNLLRRFVRRERGRYVPDFAHKTSEVQEEIIDEEMKRLGVVAIGMYNRQDVVILSEQLEKDLDFFKARRTDGSPALRTLKESDSVLGGFFFIHQSIAKDTGANSKHSDSAFEFLHNTFGEFLAADFILRYTVTEVMELFINRKFNLTEAINKKFSNPDSFNEGWFACLMFVPLYSRPVIIEMLQEHALKVLQRCGCDIPISPDDFIENLKYIVQNQLKMILNTRNSPSIMRNGILLDRDIPLLGYLSTYSLNLIIISSVLCPNGFEFNEDDYCNIETKKLDSKPWDKITCLWRTWFSPEDLAGLSVILKAYRENESKVIIKCNEKFEATRYEQPIDILLCISSTLADNLITGLAGSQTQRFHEITKMREQDIFKMLKKESPDLYFSYLITDLRRKINGFDKNKEMKGIREKYYNINDLIINIIEDDCLHQTNSDTLLFLFEMIECCFHRKIIFFATRQKLIKYLPRLIDDSKIHIRASIECTSGIRLLQLLTYNVNIFFYDKRIKYNESFFHNEFMETDWNEDIDRLTRAYFRNSKNDRFVTPDFELGNTYQILLLDAIENSPMMHSGEKADSLSHFFEPESLHILIETNPELLSRAILLLVEDNNVKQEVNPKTLKDFFRGFYQQLSSIGLSYFGFDATINAIKIARIVNDKEFLDSITDILHRQLFGRHPEFFSSIIYQYPTFISNLIELMPEIFSDDHPDMFEEFFFEKRIRYLKSEKIFDYIKIFHFLYCNANKSEKYRKRILESARYFTKTIQESINFSEIDLEKLTLLQLKDLLWYANVSRDTKLYDRVRQIGTHLKF